MTMASELRAHAALADYYALPDVRARIADFFGPIDGPLSAMPAAAYGGVRWLHGPEDAPEPRGLDSLADILDEGADVFRSLADRAGTLLLLDLDYLHPADPGEVWRDPELAFGCLEPARAAAHAVFAAHGIAPLELMTASGFRYLARIPREGPLHEGVEALGRGDRWLGQSGQEEERAAAGELGATRLVEYLAHEIVVAARRPGGLPVRLADGPLLGGGPFVRVDPSAYADSADRVWLRAPFSADQSPLLKSPGSSVPFVVVLPCGGRPFAELVTMRTDLERAGRYAKDVETSIPDVSEASRVLADYERSAIAAFHAEMDYAPGAAEWAGHTAGLFDTESMPPCANAVLRYPSPQLLQPRHLRTVALTLWSMGWHPRSVAALVRSRFEEPHDWGTHWRRHDPARTASFFVRLFCGAAAVGLDDGGFDCETEGYAAPCPLGGCGYDLGLLFRRLRSLRAREEAHA